MRLSFRTRIPMGFSSQRTERWSPAAVLTAVVVRCVDSRMTWLLVEWFRCWRWQVRLIRRFANAVMTRCRRIADRRMP